MPKKAIKLARCIKCGVEVLCVAKIGNKLVRVRCTDCKAIAARIS